MRTPLRILAAAGLLAVTAGLAGCGEPESTPPPAPALSVPTSGVGSDGLTVRYLGHDGSLKTLPVENFPR